MTLLYKGLRIVYYPLMNSFEPARHVFEVFRQRLLGDEELATQFQSAITMLRGSYNTKIRENRFIVGGATEHLLIGAFNGCGLAAVNVGRGDARADLIVQNPDGGEVGYSSKASFSSYNARLINTLGNTVPGWQEPTIFLFSRVGIVYCDPELLPDATKRSNDALVLIGKKIKPWIVEHPEYVIPMLFVTPSTGSVASSRTASEDVARNIARNFPRLSLP